MAISKYPTSLWRDRDFLLLWSGQLISTAGSGISQIAFPLLVLVVTGSPVQAGLVDALRSLAYILFILPADALLDRWDRKRVRLCFSRQRKLLVASWSAAFSFPIPTDPILQFVLSHSSIKSSRHLSITERGFTGTYPPV